MPPDALTSQLDALDEMRKRRFAGLTGRTHGDRSADEPGFVLLHGLTFDHRMWDPVLAALPTGRAAVAFDLPGHGDSPAIDGRGLAPAVEAIREAVLAAGLDAPIVVGHSIGGPLAAIYASTYPASGVVSIEAPLRVETFAAGVEQLRPQLTGDGFDAAWSQFEQSWRMDLVPAPWHGYLHIRRAGAQQLVLQYQADLLERPLADVLRWRDEGIDRVRHAGIPYLALASNPVDPEERAWLAARLPQAEVVVWPVVHHFPHLSDPARFAELLTRFASGVPAE